MRSTLIVVLLMLAGLSEGLGIVVLLPLLTLENGQPTDGGAGGFLLQFLEALGIEATVGSILSFALLWLILKAILFLAAMSQAGYMRADIGTALRLRMIEALSKSRWEYFTRQPLGSLTNSMSAEAVRASQLYTEACYMIAAATQVLVYALLAFFVSWQVTIGVGVWGIVLFLVLRRLVDVARRAGFEETSLLKSVNARLADGLSVIKPLKAMGQEKRLRPVLEAETRDLNAAERKRVFAVAALPAVQEPLTAAALTIGILIAVRGAGAQVSEILFTALLFYRTATRLGNTQIFHQSMMSLEGALRSMLSSIEEAERVPERSAGDAVNRLTIGVRLEKVGYWYEANDPIMVDITLSIPAGSFTAVTGPSGVGKTTLVDLIAGLIRPTEGQIFVDDRPLENIDIYSWRRLLGYVPQETVLLHSSVRQNIQMGDELIADEEILEALKHAHLDEFVLSLPRGLDTLAGEKGLRLSGGQRQRISIARALVRKPSLLILDEATTAVDPQTEREICATLRSLKDEMTILAISHQPALVAIADQVITLPMANNPAHKSTFHERALDQGE